MKIINNTDNSISIQVKGGTKYTIEANGELNNIPTEHAVFWKGLHSFLILEEEVSKEIKVEEVKEEVVEDVVEEVKEEVVEEVEEVKEEKKDKKKKSSKKSK